MASASSDLAMIVKVVDQASSDLKQIADHTENIGVKAGVASAVATKALDLIFDAAQKVVQGLASTIGAASEFEAKMSAIKAVTGASAEDMELLSAKALQLGKDTSFSASEAADGIAELSKGGVSVADIYGGAAQAALNLAAAGGVSLGTAAAIAANAMAEFNLTGESTAMVADKIAGFANATTGSVEDFKFSLSSVGAVASLAGQTFEDTATAIALMGKAGILGSDAGTSLKTMLINLQPTTKAAVGAFQELGIMTIDTKGAMQEFTGIIETYGAPGLKLLEKAAKDGAVTGDDLYAILKKLGNPMTDLGDSFDELAVKAGYAGNKFVDQAGNFKSLEEISQILHEGIEGMGEAEATLALKTAFGTDAIRAAAIMAKAGADGFNEMTEAMDKVSAADVAATRLDNLKGSMEQMSGSIETAQIMIGMAFLPVLKELADTGTQLINDFVIPWAEQHGPAMAETATNVGHAFMDVAHFVGDVLGVMGNMSGVVNENALAFSTLGGFITAAAVGFGLYEAGMLAIKVATIATTVATEGWAAAQAILNIVLTANPIGLIVVAIAGLVAGLILAYNSSEDFRNIVDALWATIQGGLSILGQFKDMVVDLVQNGLGDLDLGAFFANLATLPAQIGAAFDQLGTSIANAISGLADFLASNWQQIVTVALAVLFPPGAGLFLIVTHFDEIRDAIMQKVNEIVSAVGSIFSSIGQTISDALSGAGGFLAGIWQDVLDSIDAQMTLIHDAITDVWNGIPEDIRADLELIVSTVWDRFQEQLDNIGVWKDLLIELVKVAWDDVVDATISRLADIAVGVLDAVSEFTDTLGSFFDWLGTTASEAWNGLVRIVSDALDSVWSVVQERIADILIVLLQLLADINTKFHETWDPLSTIVSDALNAVWTVVQERVAGILMDLLRLLADVDTKFHETWDALADIVGSALGGVRNAVVEFGANIIIALLQTMNDVKTQAEYIGGQIIEGFVHGVQAGGDAVKGAVGGVVRGAIDYTKELLGIPGGSSLLFHGYGVEIDEGLAHGVDEGTPIVLAAFKDMMKDVKDIARSEIDGLADGIDTELDQIDVVFDGFADAHRGGWLGIKDLASQIAPPETSDEIAAELDQIDAVFAPHRAGWLGIKDIAEQLAPSDTSDRVAAELDEVEAVFAPIRGGWLGIKDLAEQLAPSDTSDRVAAELAETETVIAAKLEALDVLLSNGKTIADYFTPPESMETLINYFLVAKEGFAELEAKKDFYFTQDDARWNELNANMDLYFDEQDANWLASYGQADYYFDQLDANWLAANGNADYYFDQLDADWLASYGQADYYFDELDASWLAAGGQVDFYFDEQDARWNELNSHMDLYFTQADARLLQSVATAAAHPVVITYQNNGPGAAPYQVNPNFPGQTNNPNATPGGGATTNLSGIGQPGGIPGSFVGSGGIQIQPGNFFNTGIIPPTVIQSATAIIAQAQGSVGGQDQLVGQVMTQMLAFGISSEFSGAFANAVAAALTHPNSALGQPVIDALGAFYGVNSPDIGLLNAYIASGPHGMGYALGGVITSPTFGLIGENASTSPEIISPVYLMKQSMTEVLRDTLSESILRGAGGFSSYNGAAASGLGKAMDDFASAYSGFKQAIGAGNAELATRYYELIKSMSGVPISLRDLSEQLGYLLNRTEAVVPVLDEQQKRTDTAIVGIRAMSDVIADVQTKGMTFMETYQALQRAMTAGNAELAEQYYGMLKASGALPESLRQISEAIGVLHQRIDAGITEWAPALDPGNVYAFNGATTKGRLGQDTTLTQQDADMVARALANELRRAPLEATIAESAVTNTVTSTYFRGGFEYLKGG